MAERQTSVNFLANKDFRKDSVITYVHINCHGSSEPIRIAMLIIWPEDIATVFIRSFA